MIVKNEEDVLERCLENAHICFDEIIIVDTGSSDRTKQIAKKFTNKIFDFVWVNDFAKARNFAFSKASKDLVMWLDADDVLTKTQAEKIRQLANSFPDDVSNVRMVYHIAFDQFDKPTFSYYRERLFLKKAGPIWVEPVHEYVSCPGKTIYTDIEILHKKTKPTPKKRNLKIFENLIKNKQPLSPRLQYYYARELFYNKAYKKAIKYFNVFLNNENGWRINKAEACLVMADCFVAQKNNQEALKALYNSFIFEKPTAEACCKIAEIFATEKQTNLAIFWYKMALEKATALESGFVQKDYYGYIPAINLCVLYYHNSDIEASEKYNQIAEVYKPKDKAVLINKNFFKLYKLKTKSKIKKIVKSIKIGKIKQV